MKLQTGWKHVMFAIAFLCSIPQASAGWMDQISGVLKDSALSESTAPAASIATLSNSDMIAGLKDALKVGSENVVEQLSRTDGFDQDPAIHIPLPKNLETVKSALSGMGMGGMMDDLELRLNRAAETATPKAKRIFSDSIKTMSFDDAKKILNGPNDAATQYFKGKMSSPLSNEMRPVVVQALNQSGAIQAYGNVMGQYQSLPFVPDVKANLTEHVLELGLSGIFHYMAAEEAAIRKDPVKRTTDILQKVFSR